MDPGINDVAAGQMDGTGYSVKEPGMIGCKNGNERCTPIGIEARVDGQVGAFMFQKMLGVAFDNVIGLRDPICIGKYFCECRKFVGRQSQCRIQSRLFRCDAFVSPLLFMPEPKHLFSGFI